MIIKLSDDLPSARPGPTTYNQVATQWINKDCVLHVTKLKLVRQLVMVGMAGYIVQYYRQETEAGGLGVGRKFTRPTSQGGW